MIKQEKTVNGITITKTTTALEDREWIGSNLTGRFEDTVTVTSHYTDDVCRRLEKVRGSRPGRPSGLPPIPWEDPEAWAAYEAHRKWSAKFSRVIERRGAYLEDLFNSQRDSAELG